MSELTGNDAGCRCVYSLDLLALWEHGARVYGTVTVVAEILASVTAGLSSVVRTAVESQHIISSCKFILRSSVTKSINQRVETRDHVIRGCTMLIHICTRVGGELV